MDDRTVINRAVLPRDQKTQVNQELAAWRAAQEDRPLMLAPGEVLFDRFTVIKKLSAESGEADLYLCESKEKKQIVAKVYRRKAAVKKEVASKLREIRSPYVARLYGIKHYREHTVEILQYFSRGSIQGRKYTLEQLRKTIIPCINEGLHALHEKGIIHKDLKPSNVMLCDDGQRVAIIDFGISSLMNAGSTVLMTQTGMTPAYSAPETFRDLYLVESDYFSFGVLLLELYCGHLPYAGLSQAEAARYAAIQRIPIPEDIPTPLANLIAALTYPDLTNRGKTENPNRRWTYVEVKNWLAGVEQPVPGGMVGKNAMKSFQFMGNAYTNTQKFAEALALHWEEGKRLLFHSKLANHFSTCNLDAAKWCREAENEARQSSGHDDRIYWKLLCRLAPGQTQFWWKGQRYESLPAFGRELLEKLWANDKGILSIADSILSEDMLTAFVQEKDPKNEKLMRVAQALEDKWHEAREADKDPYLTYYAMAYALSGQRVMMIDGRKIHTVSELSDLLKEKLEVSLQVFQDFCHTLVDVYGMLDVQLEAWLIAIGKGEQLRRWRDRMNGIQGDDE